MYDFQESNAWVRFGQVILEHWRRTLITPSHTKNIWKIFQVYQEKKKV